MTVGTRIAIRSRLQSRFGILTNQQTWKCFSFGPAQPRFERKKYVREKDPLLRLRIWDPGSPAHATLQGTYRLTPRGGFFDGRNQNRDPEPSAKPLRHSDKPTNLEMLFLRTGSTTIGEKKMLARKRAPRRRDGSGHSGPFGATRKNIRRNLSTDSPRWIL